MFESVDITNPKILKQSGQNLNYYAGYNPSFVDKLIKSSHLPNNPIIFDPWNGVGTTTTTSNINRIRSIGTDINPVMVICSKAALITESDLSSVKSLMNEIINKFNNSKRLDLDSKEDPLLNWIIPKSLVNIRNLNSIINKLLVENSANSELINYDQLSSYAAFFYLCMFKTLDELTTKFRSSNPTWIKKPKNLKTRIRPSKKRIISIFQSNVFSIIQHHINYPQTINKNLTNLRVANSNNSGIIDNSIDLIITSPPYCTRIDYAISTQILLSLLYVDSTKLKDLRDKMIGTSTIFKSDFSITKDFGRKTNKFLEKLQNHSSKASASYYLKSHIQYYESMYNSLKHLSQDVLKVGGGMVVVVQDSYYKEIHNDLQANLTEMNEKIGLKLVKRKDFQTTRTLAGINPNSKNYKNNVKPIESVMCFQKN